MIHNTITYYVTIKYHTLFKQRKRGIVYDNKNNKHGKGYESPQISEENQYYKCMNLLV